MTPRCGSVIPLAPIHVPPSPALRHIHTVHILKYTWYTLPSTHLKGDDDLRRRLGPRVAGTMATAADRLLSGLSLHVCTPPVCMQSAVQHQFRSSVHPPCSPLHLHLHPRPPSLCISPCTLSEHKMRRAVLQLCNVNPELLIT